MLITGVALHPSSLSALGRATMSAVPIATFRPVLGLSSKATVTAVPRAIRRTSGTVFGVATLRATGRAIRAGITLDLGAAVMTVNAVRVRPGAMSLAGLATLDAAPTSAFLAMLDAPTSELVFAAELYPWALAAEAA
jgi:hypothetical protein